MRSKFLAALLLLTSTIGHVHAQDPIEISEKTPFSIGESFSFQSGILNEQRTINVYLPANYQTDSARSYPVIYLLDGSADEDFIHIAGIVQFATFSWINMLPESIVIGIANVDRKRDFTYPTSIEKDREDFPTTGGSKKFIDFIENELQPLINSQYRTDTFSTVIGQSLGGLLATEILLTKPHLFDNYVIISPSLWWDNGSLLTIDSLVSLKEKGVYVGVGKEGEVMEVQAKELYEKLKSREPNMRRLYFSFFEKQNHGDVLHLAAYDGFEKLFSSPEIR